VVQNIDHQLGLAIFLTFSKSITPLFEHLLRRSQLPESKAELLPILRMRLIHSSLLAFSVIGSLANAATVLQVDFSNLTQGVNVTDGNRIEDISGNGYHGFFGQAGTGGSAVVATATGTGIDNADGTGDGYIFVRDGLTGIPDAWDGPTTTVSPYFNLDGSANGSFTLEAVVNWNSTSSGVNGIMGQTGGDQIWVREQNGFLDYAIGESDAVARVGAIDISAAKADSAYHSIAIVYDGAAGEVLTYLDGILLDTNGDADIGTLPATMLNNTGDFRLGGYNGIEGWEFNGIMDQFRISDTALTTGEFLSVPEPASFALLAGLSAIGYMVLRRRS
jgi:hypothetical protein